jgi:hypothetical protein
LMFSSVIIASDAFIIKSSGDRHGCIVFFWCNQFGTFDEAATLHTLTCAKAICLVCWNPEIETKNRENHHLHVYIINSSARRRAITTTANQVDGYNWKLQQRQRSRYGRKWSSCTWNMAWMFWKYSVERTRTAATASDDVCKKAERIKQAKALLPYH